MGLSFAARVAVLLGTALCLLVGTAFVCYALTSQRPDWSVVLRWPVLLTIVVLLVAIPLAVYHALRLWLEGDQSRYPDIDQAWQTGLEELHKQAVNLQQVPLFLVLGSPGRELSDALLASTGYERVVDGSPEGRAPLCWYATREAVFLFTEETGCLSRLSSVVGRSQPVAERSSVAAAGITGTLVAGGGAAAFPRPPIPRPTTAASRSPIPVPPGPPAPAPGPSAAAIRGTLMPEGADHRSGESAPAASSARFLSHKALDEEADRLRYIGQLLRRERQPLCPLNGQMVLVAAPLLRDIVAAQETSEAIRRDLDTLREATQLSCPVTLLVTGMESVTGFNELVRRVGVQLAKETRFGKGYNVWSPADPENMDALSSQACGAFEDWVYTLFRETGGLAKPGNSRLYRLLCQVRGQFQQRIRSLLIHAFGRDDSAETTGFWMFGGCYFAATGSAGDQQAFVRSVLDKMQQQDEDVEWTESALNEDQRYRRIAQGLTFLNVALALILVGTIVWMVIS
jgi:hypothetical protein